VIDLTNMRYFFELTTRPNVIWVDLSNFDLKPGAPAMILNELVGRSRRTIPESRKGAILTGSWANT
jgi:penicillin V acylase-like amidase (Ntn superfamily)